MKSWNLYLKNWLDIKDKKSVFNALKKKGVHQEEQISLINDSSQTHAKQEDRGLAFQTCKTNQDSPIQFK